jgi:hypothetical protein
MQRNKGNNFLKNRTGARKQASGNDPKTKKQSSQSRPLPCCSCERKACEVHTKTTMMLLSVIMRVLYNINFVHKARSLTNISIYQSLEICDAVCHKQQQKWESGERHIPYDNDAAHLIQPMQQFLAEHGIQQMRWPHYSH